jgi:hypothetical protein
MSSSWSTYTDRYVLGLYSSNTLHFAHLLWLTGNSPSSALAISASGQTLQDHLSRLVPATSWAVTHVLITDEGSAIAEAIQEGRCVSVSDGSLKDQYGTSAWAIEAEASVDRCTEADIPPAAASKQIGGLRDRDQQFFNGLADLVCQLTVRRKYSGL